MRFAITKTIGQYPFNSLPVPCQTLQWDTIFSPDEAFIPRVPVKFKVFLFLEILRYFELDPDPMGGPAGAKELSDCSLGELVRGGLLK